MKRFAPTNIIILPFVALDEALRKKLQQATGYKAHRPKHSKVHFLSREVRRATA